MQKSCPKSVPDKKLWIPEIVFGSPECLLKPTTAHHWGRQNGGSGNPRKERVMLEAEEMAGHRTFISSMWQTWRKNPHVNAGDTRGMGPIPGSGRSSGIGNSNPLQCSCLGSPMDRGTWWAAVHGVAKSRTHLNEHIHAWNRPEETYHGLSGLGRP